MAPDIGTPVTWHRQSEELAGEIVRIASTGKLFWFQLKDGSKFRAVLIEGIWREDLDCWPVDLRAPSSPAGDQPVGALDEALHRLSRLEPWLLKRRWYPMTSMLMQGVKTSAAVLVDELERWPEDPAPEKARATEKAIYLRRLIAEFRRIT
jgi:hypothetical protein